MQVRDEMLKNQKLDFEIDGVGINLSCDYREGSKAPILFLHGFGSTKEDYADVVRWAAFNGHKIIAYDAPGCGESNCGDPSAISIEFLVETALRTLEYFDVKSFHLVGHSMGGLTALMLAHRAPTRILSFADIEGNIAQEDCFLSRQVDEFPADDPGEFMSTFIKRTKQQDLFGHSLYAASLAHKVDAAFVPYIFRSMVDLSDNGNLIDKFLRLPCSRMFIYGSQNKSLSYLPRLRAHGVKLVEIPSCGHFPMYSNPIAMWAALATHISF